MIDNPSLVSQDSDSEEVLRSSTLSARSSQDFDEEPLSPSVPSSPATLRGMGCALPSLPPYSTRTSLHSNDDANEKESGQGAVTVAGVEWKRSWSSLFLVGLAALVLLGWILGAVVLSVERLSVPLDYDPFRKTFVSYNVFISGISSALSIIVGVALGRGFQGVLRHLVIRRRGVSFDMYNALVDWATGRVHYRVLWISFIAMGLLVTTQLFPPATMAAFGSTVDDETVSRPYNLVRICDNLASLDNDSFIAWAKTATSLGDGDYAVFASFAQAAFDLKSVNARVYPTYELYDLVKHPLFHSNFHVGGLYSGNVTGFSSSDTKKILASGNVAIDLVTEAFWSNISCEDVSSTASFSSSLASGDRLTSYNISFPCATRQVAYLRSSTLFDVTYDAFACDNGDPKMYVWGVNTSSGALPAMYECTLNSATSVDADVRIKVSKVSTGVVKVEPQQRDITSLPLVPYLGEFLLNRYGSTGWEELSRWMQDDILPFEYIPLTPDEKVDFLSTLLSVEMAIALASFSGGLLNTDTADWAVSERVFREYKFDVLRIHLLGVQHAWFLVPSLLLLLILYLAYFLFTHDNDGSLDLTDPLSAALLGLGSPQDESVGPFASGHARREGGMTIRLREVNSDGGGGVGEGMGGGGERRRIVFSLPQGGGQGGNGLGAGEYV